MNKILATILCLIIGIALGGGGLYFWYSDQQKITDQSIADLITEKQQLDQKITDLEQTNIELEKTLSKLEKTLLEEATLRIQLGAKTNWQTHTDAESGVSFSYPPSYEYGTAAGQPNDAAPGFWLPQAFNAPDCGECFSDINLEIVKVPTDQSLTDYIVEKFYLPSLLKTEIENQSNGLLLDGLYQFNKIQIGDRQFLKIDGGESFLATWYYTKNNDTIVGLLDFFQDNPTTAAGIAETIKFK
ncbi:MAG: hypothetical protein RB292_04845 [Patescibacteria group bacterium]|jgi:hypothetical protein|nr:hypothetical protein [Patescibacteria group bacterium]